MKLVLQQTGTGVVVDTRNGYIWIIPDNPCKPNEECHANCGLCSGKKDSFKKKVFVKDATKYTNGQKITYKMFYIEENISAFIVFGIPVFLTTICAISWCIYNPQTAESPLALFTSGVALTTGIMLVRLIDTLFRKHFPSTVNPETLANPE